MDGITLRSLKLLLTANFYISVILLILASIMSVSGGRTPFEFHDDLYGPLANNLKLMLVYLAVTEIFLCAYCYYSKNFKVLIVAGFFLILTSGSLTFYSVINGIAVDDDFFVFFLYTGLSHVVFGVMGSWERSGKTPV
ncbi:MAG: hypothetical protein ACU841_02870 [Gammaproteobacteria bacterium]